MLTFEEAYEFTSTIGSHTSFEKEECAAYFDVLMSLDLGSCIVEVGLEYGRSSSIALQVAQERKYDYLGFDPFDEHPEIRKAWEAMANPFVEFRRKSYVDRCMSFVTCKGIETRVDYPITAILIDGDHSYEGVKADCEHFLPHVETGGYALFHDYQRQSLPEVTLAVNEYMLNLREWFRGFEPVEVVGTLGIWRKR